MSLPARRRIALALGFGFTLVLLTLLAAAPAAAAAADDCAERAMKPAALVEAKRAAGESFAVAELLAGDRQLSTKARGIPDELGRESVLHRPDFAAVAGFLTRKPETFTLPVDGPSGRTELELVRVDVTTPDFTVVTGTSNGQAVPYEPGLHYRGKVKDDPDSHAAVSVFRDEVMGSFFRPADGAVVIGRLLGKNLAGDHIVYATRAIDAHNDFTCGNEDAGETEPVDQVAGPGPNVEPDWWNLGPAKAAAKAPSLDPKAVAKCVRVYVEADYDVFQDKGSVAGVANYVTGFFNQSAVLYANAQISIALSQVFVWNIDDPYTGADTDSMLSQFQFHRKTFNGDLGHLVAFHGGGGLAAGFQGLCNPNIAQRQCFSGIDSGYANVPTFSWTVQVFTHEMGHLMGSRHTHACVWNGINNTAIDGCAPVEGNCSRPGLPAGGGTIMSYCHQQNVGINFSQGFGPQPGNLIRSRFNGAGCLGTCGSTQPPDTPPNGPGTCGTTQCGTITCPTNCYPESTNACGTSLFGTQTTCKTIAGNRFNTCEDHCPDGYYVDSARANVPSCQRGYGGIQMGCAKVGGNSLTTCQTQCPAGYHATSVSQNPVACGVAFGNWQTRCDKDSADTFNTCDDDCPSGYYPAATSSNPVSCGGPYGGIQTQCRKLTGNTLNVCGNDCPSGYFQIERRTNVLSCQLRFGGVQSVCSTSPSQQCDEGCPAGFYVKRTAADSGCSNGVRTYCEPVSGNSLRTCQTSCPSGYFANSLSSNVGDCSLLWSGFQTKCDKPTGNQVLSCEDGCPAGYYLSATRDNVGQCGGRYHGLQSTCPRIQGELLRTCEDRCPDNYYPSAVNTNIGDCNIRHAGIQTACSLAQGDSFYTCGNACPPNYFPGATSTNFGCGAVYSNQQTFCSKVPGHGSRPVILQHPQSVSIVSGNSATLTVVVAGQTPFSYQWYLGASGDFRLPINGARNSSITVRPFEDSSYWVRVTNNLGETLSNTATVQVTLACVPPAITAQPQSVTIPQGGTATLAVTASGSGLDYQWFLAVPSGWSPISGATASTLEVSPAVTSNYRVRVHNDCGTLESSTAKVTVQEPCTPPAVTTHPQSVTITAGTSTTLSVVATGSNLTYQWYEGSSGDTSHPVAGATLASLEVRPSQTTSYWVRVSNDCDHADSNTAVVTVTVACVPPRIQVPPQPVTIDAGQSATLSVVATGTELSYQWYRGQAGDRTHPVANGNGATVVVTPLDTTTYWVDVFNGCGSFPSFGVIVTVQPGCVPPVITRQPQSVAILPGQTTTLSVAASGSDVVYLWYQGAAPDTSQPLNSSGPALTVSPTQTTSYWVRVINDCGSADSFTATVTVAIVDFPPVILAQPQPVTINAGQSTILSVTASGTSPLDYQWYQGSSGDTSQPLPGATGASVTVAPPATTRYWVRVSNNVGTVDSSAAEVTVTAVCVSPAITTQPQSTTIQQGQSAALAAAASGTSPIAHQWYRGSSPDVTSPVAGGVGSTLVVAPTSTTSYWMRASNACGFADTQAAVVTVAPPDMPPAIMSQPQSVTITAGQSTTLHVGATGTSPLAYQWYRGPVGSTFSPVAGGTGAAVTVAPTETTDYWVRVTNNFGSVDSNRATVTVQDVCNPPSIQQQPQSVTINQGGSAMLSVSGSGTSLQYQWYRGSAPSTSNPVAGGDSAVLFVSPSTTTSYWVRLFNSCGSANSSTATVTVNVGCGPDGTPCGGDGHHTCQNNQCVCTDCGSAVCCGSSGNSFCNGQQFFDANTGYNGACASSLPSCGPANDFNGDNELYHDGDIFGCVKKDGVHQWFPRRPSPRCLEVGPVCTYLCAYNLAGGQGFQCESGGWWSQNPPLPYCYGGTIPDAFLCD